MGFLYYLILAILITEKGKIKRKIILQQRNFIKFCFYFLLKHKYIEIYL